MLKPLCPSAIIPSSTIILLIYSDHSCSFIPSNSPGSPAERRAVEVKHRQTDEIANSRRLRKALQIALFIGIGCCASIMPVGGIMA